MTEPTRQRNGGHPAVLIADDDPGVQALLSAVCEQEGCTTRSVSTGRDAIKATREEQPDLILMDALMPDLDGFEATRLLKSNPATAAIPVLILTGLKSREDRLKGIASGANDFLTKPIDAEDLALRVRNHLKIKEFHDFLRDHAAILERQVAERTQELQQAFERLRAAHERITTNHRDTILRLAALAEFRDEDTGAHIRRISRYARELSGALAMGEEFTETIGHAVVMHDIGKVAVPDRVLLKPAALSADEWEIMKSHTVVGASILKGADSPYLVMGERIAAAHHERWDGSGYPHRLAGAAIPLPARITQMVDQYDALRSPRPYKRAFSHAETMRIITQGDGRTEPRHFDPDILIAFVRVADRMEKIFAELQDDGHEEQVAAGQAR